MRSLTLAMLLSAAALPALAQRVAAPEEFSHAQTIIGRDATTLQPCYVGTSATCQVPVSGASGGGGAATTTPSTSGQAAAPGQNVNSQNLVYDSANGLWRNWLGTPAGVGYVGATGSSGALFTQGVGAADANTLRAYNAGGSVTVFGSAGTAFTQGSGATDANTQRVHIGGSVTLTATGSGADATTATNPQVAAGVYKTTPTTYTNGQQASELVDVNGRQIVVGPQTSGAALVGGGLRMMGSDGTNARDLLVSTNGQLQVSGPYQGGAAATPTYNYFLMGGTDGTNGRVLLTTPTGVLATPQSGSANRIVTRTAVSANTSTTVCPASTTVVATTLFLPISGTGVGWAGQALTTATPGTAATTPEFATAAANFTWTPLVAPTNLITVYSGTAFTAVCVQDVRQ